MEIPPSVRTDTLLETYRVEDVHYITLGVYDITDKFLITPVKADSGGGSLCFHVGSLHLEHLLFRQKLRVVILYCNYF